MEQLPVSQNRSPLAYAWSRNSSLSFSENVFPYVPLAPIRPSPSLGTRGPWRPSGRVGNVLKAGILELDEKQLGVIQDVVNTL